MNGLTLDLAVVRATGERCLHGHPVVRRSWAGSWGCWMHGCAPLVPSQSETGLSRPLRSDHEAAAWERALAEVRAMEAPGAGRRAAEALLAQGLVVDEAGPGGVAVRGPSGVTPIAWDVLGDAAAQEDSALRALYVAVLRASLPLASARAASLAPVRT